jgi:hypothetical protein
MNMGTYNLHVKIDGQWVRRQSIVAADHTGAFRIAMSTLQAEDYSRPIRLEQEEDRQGESIPTTPP